MWYSIKFLIAVITLTLVVDSQSRASLLDDTVVLEDYYSNTWMGAYGTEPATVAPGTTDLVTM